MSPSCAFRGYDDDDDDDVMNLIKIIIIIHIYIYMLLIKYSSIGFYQECKYYINHVLITVISTYSYFCRNSYIATNLYLWRERDRERGRAGADYEPIEL
jgi:hypothetical protein